MKAKQVIINDSFFPKKPSFLKWLFIKMVGKRYYIGKEFVGYDYKGFMYSKGLKGLHKSAVKSTPSIEAG